MLKISLQLKLLIFFILITAAPLILVDLVWFNTSRNEAVNSASFEVKRINEETRAEIKGFFTKQISQLNTLAKLNSITKYTASTSTDDLITLVRQNSEIEELQLVDEKGNKLFEVLQGQNLLKNDREITNNVEVIRNVLEKDDMYVGDVMLDQDNKPTIILATQIKSPLSVTSGKRYLLMKVFLTDFLQSLKNQKTIHSAYVSVSDRQGRLLVSNKEGSAPLQSSIDTTYIQKLKTHFSDSSETYRTSDEENGEALVYYSVDVLSQWNIVSQAPLEGSVSTLRDIKRITIILFLLTLAFVTIGGFLLARNIIKPINQLKSESKQIAQGLFNHPPIVIKSGDEIAELADAFNGMSKKLKETFDKLDTINFELYSQKETASAERNKLSLILSGIDDGVIVVDRNRQIIIFNAAAERMTGRSAAFVKGRPIHDVIRLFDKTTEISSDEYCPIRNDDFEGITYSKNELKLDAQTDKEVVVNLLAGHIKEGRQVGIGCILSLHDVTEKHRLEAMKVDFVSMAAHELRTPLTAIHGYLTLYREENKAKLDAQQNFLLDSLKTAADTLTNLVESLLNVTRLERGVLVIYPKPMDWVTIINNSLKVLFPTALQKKVTLQFIPPVTPLALVCVDPLRIREVLSNLITNALNYTHEGGSVTVSVEQVGNEVITHVADTGIGIPPEATTKLFHKFYRVSNEFSSTRQGTGLGLYISKSIVDLHHGRIWVTSVLGKGSVFHFSLPISNENTNSA